MLSHPLAPPHHTGRKVASSGFMLMEVLISILIFSVGVLALIGLQAKLSKAQGASKLRTDAAYLAQEVIGTMWADIANASNYASNCSGYAMCNDWLLKVSNSLPSGAGSITYDAAQDIYTVTITWAASSEGHSYTTSTTLKSADATL